MKGLMQVNEAMKGLWVEKFRPQSVEDCILPKDTADCFANMVDKGEPQNLLLSGGAGCGKTSVAKALCLDLGCDWLMVNCSEDGNIDTLRTKIRQFASTVSLTGGVKKVVILDEFDYANCVDDTEPILMACGKYKKLEELEIGKEYDVISFNTTTKEFEKDKAYRSLSGTKEVYEIEFEDGTKVNVTNEHNLICLDIDGNIVEKSINDGLYGFSVVALK